MPDEQNKVIFGAEFDGQNFNKGIEEVLDTLDKAREAEQLLKQSINETTAAMKENRKEAEKLKKQKFLDPEQIKKQAEEVGRLNAEYDDLVGQQAKLIVVQKKVNDVSKDYVKTQNQQKKNSEEISKAVGKFTNVNALAADGVKKIGNYAKDAAFSLVSGFAGGIVASVLPAIVEWIGGLADVSEELTELKKNQAIVNGVLGEAAKGAGDDIARLDIIKRKLNDRSILEKDRVLIAKEYNKTADETNKIDIKQINNLDLINERIDAQNKLIIQRAISVAALAKLTEASTAFVDAQLKLTEQLKASGLSEEAVSAKSAKVAQEQAASREKQIRSLDGYTQALSASNKIQVQGSQAVSTQLSKEEKAVGRLIADRNRLKNDLEKLGDLLNPLITPAGLTTKDPATKDKAAAKEIENVFEQQLRQLQARLAGTASKVFESESLIREKFSKQLDKEFGDIAKLLEDKKLDVDQARILEGFLININTLDLNKGLEEFKKKAEAALKGVNDALINLQVENETKRVNNLRDEFEREKAQIETNFDQTLEAIGIRQAELIKKINDETEKGLIDPAVAKRKKFIASLFFGDLLDQAEQAKMNAQADLAFKTFQRTLEKAKAPFEDQLLEDNEASTELIRQQTALFLEGKISYEAYQKELTRILKTESNKRRRDQIAEAEEALRLINIQLQKTTDPAQLKQLEAQRDALRAQISALNRELATGAASDQDDEDKKKMEKLIAYANAIQGLASSVASFWQQVNAAEAAALDRSIGLQNKRVENAKELAEKGNAEYLEMEQKRLDDLERKREENARKQLAINNALVASQALVAAITAIAQAVSTGSPLAAIAAVAAVIGAIGAAFSFVNSLQPQEPGFYEGTEYVEGKGAPAGKDQVRARLHVGERVVTAKDNADYWNTLSAIHNRTVPAEALNQFVEAYPNGGFPMVDFGRLSVATDGKLGSDNTELLGRVDKLNETMENVVDGLSEIGVNVRMDQEGFEVGFSKARKRRMLRRRS